MMQKATYSASQWYVRIHSGDVDTQTRNEFDAWLAEDIQHELDYIECEIAELALHDLKATDVVQCLERRVEEDIHNHRQVKASVYRRVMSLFAPKSVLGLASACVGMVALYFVFTIMLSLTTTSVSEPQIYATSLGEQKKFVLDDGSTVYLNTASQLTVHYTNERRQLSLQRGEAIFNVAHDAERPFDVKVGDRTVRAVGTQFNILIGDSNITVSVLEGVVNIVSKHIHDNKDAVEHILGSLEEGDSTNYLLKNDTTFNVQHNTDTKRIHAWQRGQLEFDSWRLLDAIHEHNRYAKTKIYIGDTSLASLRIAGIFDVGDTHGFITALESVFPIQTVIENNEIWLERHD